MFSAATSGSAGASGQASPNDYLYGQYLAGWSNPAGFKLFNIAIHGLNAVLVLFLAYRIP